MHLRLLLMEYSIVSTYPQEVSTVSTLQEGFFHLETSQRPTLFSNLIKGAVGSTSKKTVFRCSCAILIFAFFNPRGDVHDHPTRTLRGKMENVLTFLFLIIFI
jgi:hypothetical protein